MVYPGTPGYFMKSAADGPYCVDHYIDSWVEHRPFGEKGPPCYLGVHYDDHSFGVIKKVYQDVANRCFAQTGQHPTYSLVSLGFQQIPQLHFTRKCDVCQKSVSFWPDPRDFDLGGNIQEG